MDGLAVLTALEQTLDRLDGRRVAIQHTINHVERREVSTRRPGRSALERAAVLREKLSQVVL